jgi:hypothetical protein
MPGWLCPQLPLLRSLARTQVRGGCKNLVLDLGLVLEGQHAWELPEVLLGAVRCAVLWRAWLVDSL